MKKTCSSCNIKKSIDNFCKVKGYRDGYQNECRECKKIRGREYRKSKKGVISDIYNGQKHTSKRRKMNSPSYTRKWLENWLITNPEFHRLYDIWVLSSYETDLKPSVDRIDDYIGYTEYNIQLTTWLKNLKRSHEDRKNGVNNKTNKAVLQFTKKGKFVAEFYSLANAGIETGIDYRNISNCCNGRVKYTQGYIFKFKIKE